MSLYNMLMGRNPNAPYLLLALGINTTTMHKYPLGRVRDVYTNDAADRIFVLHRNYGSNDQFTPAISKHPSFVSNTPTSDSTYLIYEFMAPQEGELAEVVRLIAAHSDNTPPWDRYTKAIKDMENGVENEQTKHMLKVGEQIIGGVVDQMKSTEPGYHQTDVITDTGSVSIVKTVDESEGS